MKKFEVVLALNYKREILVGVKAINKESALEIVKEAFDCGTLWDNSQAIQLLDDDYEALGHRPLYLQAQETQAFSKPSYSVRNDEQFEAAKTACLYLLEGNQTLALQYAHQATAKA